MISESTKTNQIDNKNRLIIQTVGDLFLEYGYSRVSINLIISKIGGSKRDLYAQFGDKEGLFRSVIADVCQQVLVPLKALPVEGGSIEQALTSFGRIFLSVLLSSRVIALQKLVLSEATRYPEFAKTFVQLGPVSAYNLAAELLMKRAEVGEIKVSKPKVMGALFCDMLISDLQFKIISGEIVTDSQIDERVEMAVLTFLNGIKS
ncbi:TetR/AcrR family transcriptional regulator [Acinetobacter baumannii]|uniref:TetR/AcrR family transcriptional regulator n=1 Tax=Acinetobacter baumannii TaxID=470 RepID=UPI0021C9FCF0|nr:TetR/AcrR family transcriptional regulator [Acinetobacter baumannii]